MSVSTIIGRSPERLSLTERQELAGKWYALEMYSPSTLPLKTIEALGDSVPDCVRQLTSRGLDARNFEFTLIGPPPR